MGIGFLGRLGALQTYSVIGALLMGCWGMWSVTAGFFTVRARAIGMATYAAAPLPYVAIEGGRWGVLLCYAALPWMIRMFVKVGTRPSGAAFATPASRPISGSSPNAVARPIPMAF